MSRLLLDTSAYAAFMRGHDAITAAVQRADEISLNAIVLGELRAGFLAGRHRARNDRELETFRSSPRVRIVDVDADTAERYAVILKTLRDAGTPVPTNDIWIAASAMQHGLAILTTDTHYRHIAQVIVTYFEPEKGRSS